MKKVYLFLKKSVLFVKKFCKVIETDKGGQMSLLQKIFGRKQKPITVQELRNALHNNELTFYYQPEWELKTNRLIGLEALMRWESPTRGIVPPLAFIPILEKHGAISEFTEFLLNKTLSDLTQIHAFNPDCFVSINLSIQQLQQKNLIQLVQNALQQNNLLPKHLEIELTESEELTDDILDNGVLQEFAKMQLPVSIDDFGTGYSSFERLKKLNISKLKIDISFIQSLDKDDKNKAIVSSIIKLGHDLGFPVLAEGVETTSQQSWLKDNGCDYAQGFWYSRALPLDQLKEFLKEKKDIT